MDPAATSRSPWEILVNPIPTNMGLETIPQFKELATESLDWIGSGTFFDGALPLFFALKRAGNDARIDIYNLDGVIVATSTITTAGELWANSDDYSMVSLNSKGFFSQGQKTFSFTAPWAATPFGQTWNSMTGDAYQWCEVNWQPGINAPNWPYVTGAFGAPVLATHLKRVYYAGFTGPTLVTYDDVYTDELLAEFDNQDLASPWDDKLTMNPQCIVWTDANNPFAIGIANAVQVGTEFPIVDLVSWRDKLFVFTEGDIWLQTGGIPEEFFLRPVTRNMGIAKRGNAVATPAGTFFINEQGAFVTDGERVQEISEPVWSIFDHGIGFPAIYSELGCPFSLQKEFGRCVYIADRNEVWFPVRSWKAGSRSQDGLKYRHCLVYSITHRAWSIASQSESTGAHVGNFSTFDGLHSIGSTVFCISENHLMMMAKGQRYYTDGAGAYVPHDTYHLAVTKPFAMEASPPIDWRKARVTFRAGMSGTIYLLGEEHAYDEGDQLASHALDYKPHWMEDTQADNLLGPTGGWTTGPTGTSVTTRPGTWAEELSLDVKSSFARIAMYGNSPNRVIIRGLELMYRQVAQEGGK